MAGIRPLLVLAVVACVFILASCLSLLSPSPNGQTPSPYSYSFEISGDSPDKCTLMLLVYDRMDTFLAQLAHYQEWSILDSIVVVWNHPTLRAPEGYKSYKKLPIRILYQERNSLINRFKPFSEVRTDCVISMDDDYLIPETSQKALVDLFFNGHSDQLIGYKSVARSHSQATGKTWNYVSPQAAPYSMVLPSGMTFHRRYLDMFTELPPVAHDIVDSIFNCEDVLINLMVANATGLPPVVVDAPAELWQEAEKRKGLSYRNGHIESRSWCMTTFVHLIFGKMTLVSTNDVFSVR